MVRLQPSRRPEVAATTSPPPMRVAGSSLPNPFVYAAYDHSTSASSLALLSAPDRPRPKSAASPGQTSQRQQPALVSGRTGERQAVVSSALWQRLDLALQGAARARAEARRSESETLNSLDNIFGARDDARMKARSLVAQTSRAAAKLHAALQQLEGGATAALTAHNTDVNALAEQQLLRMARAHAQHAAVVAVLRKDLSLAEREHVAHARTLTSENDRIELERAEERTIARNEVRRLAEANDQMRATIASLTGQAKQEKTVLQADGSQLRQKVATLEAENEKARAAHAADTHKYSELVAQLRQANATLRDQLAHTTAELEQTRLELGGKLERLEHTKEASVSQLKAQLGSLQRSKTLEEEELKRAIDSAEAEKQRTSAQLHERLRALQADREADANFFKAKLDRLKGLQTAALAAGSARGRQLLYTESLKSPQVLRNSTMSWRGEDDTLFHSPDSAAMHSADSLLYHSPLHHEYESPH